MEQRRDRTQEGRFFALEKRCQRMAMRPGFERVVSWLYDKTSKYGQSLSRPGLGLIGLVLVAAPLIYFVMALALTEPVLVAALNSQPGDLAARLFGFAAEQMFRPFEIWSVRYPASAPSDGVIASMLSEAGLALKIVAALQTLASLALVTEFVLALRWRFRRG